MARVRLFWREAKYWTGRWVARRLDSAKNRTIDRFNRE